MGIYSRDYLRDDPRGWRSQWGTPGCKWIIAANIIVFVLQLLSLHSTEVTYGDVTFTRPTSAVTEALELDPARVLHGEVWRLVTYAFCHQPGGGIPWHIIINMLFVGWWGTTLERMYGTREFVLFYLTAALASGLAFLGLSLLQGDPTPAIGASGAVMAIMALYAIFFPREEILLFFLLRVQIRFVVLGYLIYDLVPVLQSFGGTGISDGVAHAAHLGGLAFGFAYHRFGWRIDRLGGTLSPFIKRRAWVRPRHVRVYRPPEESPQNFDLKVDAILDKIHSQGEASLTEQERDLLRKASERYKTNQRPS
ncbi:MAG TPA: rhomboid family intramembrane serine protease [Planctomycetaceae bacterium]|nr:rhomboid family intramembrane serine protease [Planctomycetaceae bacterium]